MIADISNLTHEFHLLTEKLIFTASNRQDFVDRLLRELAKNDAFLRMDTGIDLKAIHAELYRSGSWLNDDASFKKIQTLHKEKRIIHIRMNITDRTAFQVIGDWLRVNKLHCDSLYLSNIPDWLREGNDSQRQMGFLKMAINRVIDKNTHVIQASNAFPDTSGMAQMVFQGFPYDPSKIPAAAGFLSGAAVAAAVNK